MFGKKRGFFKRDQETLIAEINITPMVDVMLVLLIIFMVTSPMLVSGVNVDLPETTSAPLSGSDEPLAISVDKNGKIYLMDNEISSEALVPKLMAVTKEKKDTRIFVRADNNIDYGTVMNVVSSINEAGFTKVALVTKVVESKKKK
jgi:biopolymer transport protein TolR